jgi:hypothetical protein
MGPLRMSSFWNLVICILLISAFAFHHSPTGYAPASHEQVQVYSRGDLAFEGEHIAIFISTGELLAKFYFCPASPPLCIAHGEPIAKFSSSVSSFHELHFCCDSGARASFSIGWHANVSVDLGLTQMCISGLNSALRDDIMLHGMVCASACRAVGVFPFHAGYGSAEVCVAEVGPGQGFTPCTNQTSVRTTFSFSCESILGAVMGTTAVMEVGVLPAYGKLIPALSSSDSSSTMLSLHSGGAAFHHHLPAQHDLDSAGPLSHEGSARASAPAQEEPGLGAASRTVPIDPCVATPGSGGKELEGSLTAGVWIDGPSPGFVPEPGLVFLPPAVSSTHLHSRLHVTSGSMHATASRFIPHLDDQLTVLLLVTAFLLAAFLLWVNSPDGADCCTCMHECVAPSPEVSLGPSGHPLMTTRDICMILCVRYGRWVKGTKYVGEIPRRSAKERIEQHWAVGMSACGWCKKQQVHHDIALHAYKHATRQRKIMLCSSFALFIVALLTAYLHVMSCTVASAQGITPALGCTCVDAFHAFGNWLANTPIGHHFNPLPQGVHSTLPLTYHHYDKCAACNVTTPQAQHKPSLSRSLTLLLGDYPPNRATGESAAVSNGVMFGPFEYITLTAMRALTAKDTAVRTHFIQLLSDLSTLFVSYVGTETLPGHACFLGLRRAAASIDAWIHTGWISLVILAINVAVTFLGTPLFGLELREISLRKLQCYVAVVREFAVSLVIGAWLLFRSFNALEHDGFDILSGLLILPIFCITSWLSELLCECILASIQTAWLQLWRLCYLSLAARFAYLDDMANGHCAGDCASHGCKGTHAHAPDGSCCAARKGRDTDQAQGGLETHLPVDSPVESVPVHEGAHGCGGTAGQQVGQQGHGCVCTSGCACAQPSSGCRYFSRAYALLALLFVTAVLYSAAVGMGLLWNATVAQCLYWFNLLSPTIIVFGSLMGHLFIGATGEFSALFVVVILYYNFRNRAGAIPAHIVLLNADYSRQGTVQTLSDWIPHIAGLFTVSVLQQLLQYHPEQTAWFLQEACDFGFWNTASCVLVALMLLLCPAIVRCIELINRAPLYLVAALDLDGDGEDTTDCVPSCVVMTGVQANQGGTQKPEKWAGDYPRITAQGGIALLRQLDDFLRVCLQLHCKRPQEESVYVMALRDSCPDPSNLHTLLRDRRPELGNKTAIENAMEMADEDFAIYRAKLASGEISTGRPDHMADVIKTFYPAFVPPRTMVQALGELEVELAGRETQQDALIDSRREYVRLGDQLVDDKLRHDSRTPMEKYAWMLAHPDYNHLCKQIKSLVDLARAQERDRQDALGSKMVAMQASQFREVEHFRALNWLKDYILSKLATITRSNVTMFYKMKMLPGETPRQAYAKIVREAQLIDTARVGGFVVPVAIFDLMTREKQEDGGSFFPRALMDATKSTVATLEITREIPDDDHEARARILVDVLDRMWKDICTKPDSELSLAIRRQLQEARTLDNKNEAEFLSHELPRAIPKNDPRLQTPAPAAQPSAGGSRFECSWHGPNDTHNTQQCKLVARVVAKEKAAQAKATADRERKAQEATAATLQRENIADGGTRPGTRYHGMQQEQNDAAAPAGDGMVVCEYCSKIAGRQIKHKPGCFLKGEKKPYDGWVPFDNALLAFYNKMRASQGLPALSAKSPATVGVLNLVDPPDAARETPPGTIVQRRKVQFQDEVVAATVGEDNPAMFVVATALSSEQAAIRLNLATRGDNAADQFAFHEPSRTFTCRSCSARGAVEVSTGILLSLGCSGCNVKFMFNALPQEWRRLSLWLQDPSILSDSVRERLGMGTRGTVTTATPGAKTESSISFAKAGSEPYTPHRADEVKVSHAEVMSYLASARVFPNYGGTLSTINSASLAVILGECGNTGVTQYANRVEAILNELPDNIRMIHEDRIAKAIDRYKASKVAKDMVAAASYAQVLKADPLPSMAEEPSLMSSRRPVESSPAVLKARTVSSSGLLSQEAGFLASGATDSQAESTPAVQARPMTTGAASSMAGGSQAHVPVDRSVHFNEIQLEQQPAQLDDSAQPLVFTISRQQARELGIYDQLVAASSSAGTTNDEISADFGPTPRTTVALDPSLLQRTIAPAERPEQGFRLTRLEASVGRWLCELDRDKKARCTRIEKHTKVCEDKFQIIDGRLDKLEAVGQTNASLDQALSQLGERGAGDDSARALIADTIKRVEDLEATGREYDVGAIYAGTTLATKDLHALNTWRATVNGPLTHLLGQNVNNRLITVEQELTGHAAKLTLCHPDQHRVKQQIWRLIGPSVVAYIQSSMTPEQQHAASGQTEGASLLESLVDRVNLLEGQGLTVNLTHLFDDPAGELSQQLILHLRPALNEFVEIAAEERMADASERIRAMNQRLDGLASTVDTLSDGTADHVRTRVDNEVALISAGLKQDIDGQVRNATAGIRASVLESATHMVRDRVALATDGVQSSIHGEVERQVQEHGAEVASNLRLELLGLVDQEVQERVAMAMVTQQQANRQVVEAAVEAGVQARMAAVYAQVDRSIESRVTAAMTGLQASFQQTVETAAAAVVSQHMAPYGQALGQLHDGMVQLAQQAGESQHLGQLPQQIARMAQELGQQRDAIGFTMGAVRASHHAVQEQLRNLSPAHSGYVTPEDGSPNLPTPSQLMFESIEPTPERGEGSGPDAMDEGSLEAEPSSVRLSIAGIADENRQLNMYSELAHPLSLPTSRATSRVVTPVDQPLALTSAQLLSQSRWTPLPEDDDRPAVGSSPLDLAEMRSLLNLSATVPIVDSPDEPAPAPSTRRRPERIEFSGEHQMPLEPAFSPTGIIRLSPVRGEGEDVVAQAAPVRRLDFHDSAPGSPGRSTNDITRFVGAAHVVGSAVEDDSCTDAERAELAAWAAEIAADQPPPLATVAQVSSSGRPTDEAVRDSLLTSAEQLSESASALPAVPQEGPAKQSKRAAKRGKDKKPAKHDSSWPQIHPSLQPTATEDTLRRFVGGNYLATGDEVDRFDAFFARRPTLVWLEQKQPETSLNFYTEDDMTYLTPPRVMMDSGADVVAIISQKLANAMGLTWTKGSVNLRGVGGTSASDGTTHQKVRVRLGGCTDENSTPSPFEGCFSVLCNPVVCSPEFTQAIKADVILGQGFIWPCLGVIDVETERFSYAPAYIKHACKDFRVSVPCLMSVPRERVPPSTKQPSPSGQTTGVVMVQHADAAVAYPDVADMCDGPVSVVTMQAHKARKVDAAAAKLSPGFHAEGVPSREEHERQLKAAAERNAADRREAEAIRATQQSLVAGLAPRTLKPIGYVYSAEQIDRLNRSQPGGLLDVSGPTANEMVETERVARRVRAECSEEFSGRFRTMESALADVSRQLAQLKGERAAQPLSTLAPVPSPAAVTPAQPGASTPRVAPPASIDVEAPSSVRPETVDHPGIQTRAQRNRAAGLGAAVGAIARPVERVPLDQLMGRPTATVATAAMRTTAADEAMPQLDSQDDYA